MPENQSTDAVEHALRQVKERFGDTGMRAVAVFAGTLPAEATLQGCWEDNPEGWIPMDFVMQAAWELGGAPVEESDAR